MFLSGRFNSPIDLIWRLRFDAIWLTYSELSCFGGESVSDLAGYIGDTIFHPKIYGKTTEKQKPPRPKIRFRRPVSGRPKGMFRIFFFQNPSQSEELEEWSKKSSSWVFLEIIIWRYIFQQKKQLEKNGKIHKILWSWFVLQKITGFLNPTEILQYPWMCLFEPIILAARYGKQMKTLQREGRWAKVLQMLGTLVVEDVKVNVILCNIAISILIANQFFIWQKTCKN